MQQGLCKGPVSVCLSHLSTTAAVCSGFAGKQHRLTAACVQPPTVAGYMTLLAFAAGRRALAVQQSVDVACLQTRCTLLQSSIDVTDERTPDLYVDSAAYCASSVNY